LRHPPTRDLTRSLVVTMLRHKPLRNIVNFEIGFKKLTGSAPMSSRSGFSYASHANSVSRSVSGQTSRPRLLEGRLWTIDYRRCVFGRGSSGWFSGLAGASGTPEDERRISLAPLRAVVGGGCCQASWGRLRGASRRRRPKTPGRHHRRP
jgi:hypothetical protein